MPHQNASEIAQALPADTSQILQNKLLGVFDALQNGAVTVGNEVVKYTPDVINAGLSVVRIDCIGNIVVTSTAMLGFLIAAFVGKHYIKKIPEAAWGETPLPVLGALVVIGAFVFAIINFMNLLCVWTWVGVFEPKLYIAHEIIEKVMK